MTPTSTTPADAPSVVRSSSFVARVYGEPRFHADGEIAAVAFGPDGTLWSVDETGVLRHWTAAGEPVSRAFLSDLETLWCFGPGAAVLASANDDLLFWNVADGKLAGRVAQAAWVSALGFSADGTTLAVGHDGGGVSLWDAATRQPRGEFAAHPRAVSAVAFSPCGTFLATAGEDRSIRVWDAVTFVRVGEYLSHTDRVPALAWAADGSLFASAGWDTSARVWVPGTTDPVMLLNSHSDQVLALAFAPGGKLLATADSDNDIHLWADPVGGKASHVLRGHADEIRTLAFSPDGTRLASAGADRVVHVWDATTGKLLAGPNPAGRHAVVMAGKTLVSTGGPTVRAWDADTGESVFPTGLGAAACAAASGCGRWLAVGGTDIFTRLYDLNDPAAPAKKLEATKPPIGGLSFSADGTLLAQTSPADGLVWIWDVAKAEPRIILIEAADGCTLEGVAFHPDGNRVVVGGIDYLSTGERTGAVCVWDLTTKLKTCEFEVGVYAVCIDSSGRYAAGAGINDAVYVWDLHAEDQIFELAGHGDRVQAVAFSPDGSYLVSAGDDSTVRVWDVLSGRLLVVRELDAPAQGLAFSPDGKTLFTGNANTTCFRIPFAKLLDD